MYSAALAFILLLGTRATSDVTPVTGCASEPISEMVLEASANLQPEPSRFIVIKKSDYSPIRLVKDRVAVAGSLNDADVESLLRSAERHRADLFSKDADRERWEAYLVGDDRYALVRYSFDCGAWCGGGADLIFARGSDNWRFVCMPRTWVS